MARDLSDLRFDFDTIVIGGGQAGLAMGYYLQTHGRDFVILDAGDRVGDAWRGRWDALRLFSPAALSGLPGMPFPAARGYLPTKDETADYLEAYAGKFNLPVRLGRHVNELRHSSDGYLVSAGTERYRARHVVVATGPYQTPRTPAFAPCLNPCIVQLHSSAYHNPHQLPEGAVLVVGAGNSGAEISVDLAATRTTFLSGREVGKVPLRYSGTSISQPLLGLFTAGWWLIDTVLTADTILGKKLKDRDRRQATPLVRLSPEDIIRAGVERVPRVEGVTAGNPELADGRVLEVASVVWATGFKADFDWIELPIFDEDGFPIHLRGVVVQSLGLYFLGLPFQHTTTSAVIGGVGKDARYIADHLAGQDARKFRFVEPAGNAETVLKAREG